MRTRKWNTILITTLLILACIGFTACAGGDTQTPAQQEQEGGSTLSLEEAYAYAESVGYTGTAEEFIAAIKGEKGDPGRDGNGIAKIEKTATEGLEDTYTITYTDGTTFDFVVTNGKDGSDAEGGAKGDAGVGIEKIEKTGTEGLIDTYTITLTDETTYDFTVTNAVTEDELQARRDLEEALETYRMIVESLSTQVSDLKESVQNMVSSTGKNIGAYAVSYVDSVLNLSCAEQGYNIGCQGTGFIISEDGYVITNNHVVYYEATIVDYDTIYRDWFGYSYGTKVISGVYSTIRGSFDPASRFYEDGKLYTLEFVYRDPDSDLALCKMAEMPTEGDWQAIPFYDGATVRGDEVLVLGNAQGFGLSATSGLVSATGKQFADYPKLTFIQTDAAINGGNSGGPAINIYGGLIGVVNSKFVDSSIENMGFAIELSKLKGFLAEAQNKCEITVEYQEVGQIAE